MRVAARQRGWAVCRTLSLLFGGVLLVIAQTSPTYFTLQEVAPAVWAAVATPHSGAGANAGFVIGDDSVAVVDTFEDPAAARALLAQIRQRTDKPIRYVINTHYHLDHVAGNAVFAQAGAVIFAQRNVRAWMHTENLKFFGAHPSPAERERVAALRAPDVTFAHPVELFLGRRELRVEPALGHTGSDTIVVVPDANVVFCGDLFWNHHLPNLIDADTAAWLATLQGWAQEFPRATFIPGHGAIGTAADVAAFRDYLAFLREAVTQAARPGTAEEAVVTAVLPALRNRYGDWGFFSSFAHPNILQTLAELRGHKRLPGSGSR